MLTISPTSFRADYTQSGSMFNQKNNTPPLPADYGDDTLELMTLQKDMQKKQNKQEKLNKLLAYSSVGIAVGLLGSLLLSVISFIKGGAALDKLSKTAQNINFKDVTKEKTFDELFLSDEMKKVVDDLKTTIERAEWIKKKGGEGGSGIMLYGEPGGGKNAYVYALTKYLQTLFPGSELVMMDVLKFKGMFNGQTENNIIGFVENVIKEAKENPNKKFVVFLDEFDSIARKDTSTNASMTESFQNAFKTKLLDLTSVENIQVVAATNKASKDLPLNQLLDDAILNRFPTKINVPLPTKEQMVQAIVGHYSKLPAELVDKSLTDAKNSKLNDLCKYITRENHHASFRDYNYILEKARIISEAKDRKPGSPITFADLEQAVKQHADNENWDTVKTNPFIDDIELNVPKNKIPKKHFWSGWFSGK